MIAKDEARNIARALDSVKPLVDYVLIEDTGSTDGTQQIVNDWLQTNGINGDVVEEPWQDFAYNRSHALSQLRGNAAVDYALMLDADDKLVIKDDPISIKKDLAIDCYAIPIHHGNLRHRRAQLCNNRKPFRYRGVVHEFLHCDEPFQQAHLDSLSIQVVGGGVRGRDLAVYHHDAEMLEHELANGAEADLKPRYQFYLAQSYRDAREPEKALAAYLQRAEMHNGWIEEIYVALINAGRLMAQLEFSFVKMLAIWRRAIDLIPRRAEAYHGAAVACRNAGCLHEALDFARRGLIRLQPEGLFIEPWIYDWGLLDEYAVAAYWCNFPAECLTACRAILGKEIDSRTRARIEKNAEFAIRTIH